MGAYLVTGTAGFIGWKVAEFLLADGHTVWGVDNLNDSYSVTLKKWRLAQLEAHPNFSSLTLDICDREALAEQVFQTRTFDAVINLAARAGVRYSTVNPWIYQETNVVGALNLLELCRLHGVPKIVQASSSSLYGQAEKGPFCEEQRTDHPLSPYAASKKSMEVLSYSYHHLYGLDVSALRFFTVYGPASRPDMGVFRFVQWISEGRPVTIFGDGSQSRDFTYVDDIARGVIASIKPLGFEAINLGSDTPIVLVDAIRQFEAAIGREANFRFLPRHRADVKATWANIDKARRLLGWQPQVTFAEGVRHTVDWYNEQREWAKEAETT